MKDTSKLKDEKVVDIVRTKDKEVYSEIIKRYQRRLMRYASYLMSNEHDAADVVQQSFVKAYININSFNTKKSFSSWIYRIVHNEAMNMIKKEKKKVQIDEGIKFDSGIYIEEDYMKKELKRHTKECLDKMPVKYSEPLTLFYLEERSYEEISDILRMPVGTVGTRINRAKAMMQKICLK